MRESFQQANLLCIRQIVQSMTGADGFLTKQVSIFIIAASFIDYDKQIFSKIVYWALSGCVSSINRLKNMSNNEKSILPSILNKNDQLIRT